MPIETSCSNLEGRIVSRCQNWNFCHQVTKRLLEKDGGEWALKTSLVGVNTTSKEIKTLVPQNDIDFVGVLLVLAGIENYRNGASADEWLLVRIPKSLLFILTADRI